MPHPETLAAHAGTGPDPETGGLSLPVHLATTFEREPDGSYPRAFIYGREANPTRTVFENALADLEGGAECAAFSSGMAAASAVFGALNPGDHVLIPTDVYHGIRHLLRTHFERWGLQVGASEMSSIAGIQAAARPDTRLLWIETPSNPMLRITDIKAVCDWARERNIRTVVDGTWTTPLIQRPLDLGADLVVHSATKYIGGHSDLLGGVVIAADGRLPLFERVRENQRAAGAVMDPFSAWLAARGLRSLAARLDRQCASAQRLADMLDRHGAVERVHFPGLPGHPGHDVASRQMNRSGAMLSFEVRGGEPAAMAVAASVRIFTRATSLGGTESLIEHRASIENPPGHTPRGLLRVSVGLEHPDDLESDLLQALNAI